MKYSFIDSIRGIAILMVIFVHASQTVTLPGNWLPVIAKYGQMGVQLFFIVSAYTLCLSFEKRKGERNAIGNFYVRRFFRIAPVYYIAILGYFILRIVSGYIKLGDFSVPEQYTLVNVMANVVFVHGIYAPANSSIVPGGWSIGTEMLFYLVFPFFMASISRLMKNNIFAVSLPFLTLLVTSTIFLVAGYRVENNGFIYFSIFNQASVFAVGISLYIIHTHHAHLISNIKPPLLLLLFFGFAGISMYVGWVRPVEQVFVIVPFISSISFLFLVEIFKRLASNKFPILQKIGQRSYSIYIIHFGFAYLFSYLINRYMLIEFIGALSALIIIYLITVIATYYLAGYSVRYVENYFIGIGNYVVGKISKK